MKRILMAVALVLVLSIGALAADVTIGGEVKYGFDKYEDVDDATWYKNPAFKLTFSNDNFELRLVGQEYIDSVTVQTTETDNYTWRWTDDTSWSTLDCLVNHERLNEQTADLVAWLLAHDHEFADHYSVTNASLTTTAKYGVKVDRANVKLPVEGFGTFAAGRQLFGTSDNGALDKDPYDGLGWSGTFDKLTLKAMYAVGSNPTVGLRGAYEFGLSETNKLTVGGTYLKTDEDEDASYAVDGRVDFGESFDIYAEVGRDVNKASANGVYDEDDDDIQNICAEFRVGGFEFDGLYDFVSKETELSVEKSFNNVLFHAGYIMPDEEGKDQFAVYAKYKF